MEVFIVRPFGTKNVLKKSGEQVEFNFDKVHTALIDPALNALDLEGGTTGKIFEPGDIREDMFSLLLLADIVIADISIHNANVFYELGIRHALRDRKTVLIKSPGFDDTPFDILGYKYLEYDREDPAGTLTLLIETLRDTIDTNREDSPVFKMLPELESQNLEHFQAVPLDFRDELKIACDSCQAGMLSLMASEAEGFQWKYSALRLVGDGLFSLRAFDSARIVWEKIKNRYRTDRQANDRLATIYQRLAEREMLDNPVEGAELLVQSDLAIDNLLRDYANLDNEERAEAYGLKGRNTKTKWINTWKDLPQESKAPTALQSGYLAVSYNHYEHAYYENLNHFYAGINALSLLTIIITLAETYPAEWALKFKKQKEADRELEELKEKKQPLITTVQMSIDAERMRLETTGDIDTWLKIAEADFAFLTEDRPTRVAAMYKMALEGAKAFQVEAARRQLQIYEQLAITPESVKAALTVFPAKQDPIKSITHHLLFTGHMIDQPGRKAPRFPVAKEKAVRQKIKEVVESEINKIEHNVKGIAGGACGGDILFHEVCNELGIKTEMHLALPREQYIIESVQCAGANWIERFHNLYNNISHLVLSQTKELPNWLRRKKEYSIWERNNLWLLNNALVNGGMHLTLIALWDGEKGDGAGGTEHMVKEAQLRGAKTIVIDVNEVG
jgi:hypothetical protein